MRFWPAVFILGVVRAQSHIDTVCRTIIKAVNCGHFTYKPICATGGVQYNTECDFTKAHCLDPNLKVVKEGPCLSGATDGMTTGTTTSPTAPPTGTPDSTISATSATTTTTTTTTGITTDPSLSSICNQIVNTVCQPDINPLCAMDGQTYQNYCEFSKSRCYLPGLEIAYAGTCSGTDTFPPLTTSPPATSPPSVFEIICRTLEHITCETSGVYVCGSDGVTYPTPCHFEKSKCHHPDLTVIEC